MANDHKRRLRVLERNARNFAPALTADEIDQAVARYGADKGIISSDTPSASAFRTMLCAMRPSLARTFLHAQPADLML